MAVVIIAALGAAFVCINAEDNSAANTDTVTYHVNVNGDERSLNIILNENYFQSIDSSHTISWSYFGSNDYETMALDTAYTLDGCQFTLSKKTDGTVGEYILTLKAASDDQKTVALRIRCTITINIDDKTGGDREYVTDPLFIIVNASLNNGNALPSELSYQISGTIYPTGGVTIKEGEPVSMNPILSGTDKSADEFIWYAMDLPKGLAMTSSGVITGVPVEHNYTPTESKVYVEDWYGNGKTFTVNIIVMEADLSINYYLSSDAVTSETDVSKLIHEPSQYMTQRDKTVTLAVAIQDVKVSVVSLNGEFERIDLDSTMVNIDGINYYCYTLPTAGTGMYRVIISDQNDAKLSAFDLYVMSRLLAVQSEIIVGSDGTS